MRRNGLWFWLVWTPLAIAAALAVYVLSGSLNTPQVVTVGSPTRTASTAATPSVSATSKSAPTATTAPTSTATFTPVVVPTPTLVSIPGSEPVELYFPAFDVHILMDDKSCPVDSDGLYEPDQQKPQDACYVKDSQHPFVFPATSTADLSVILGHTWQRGNAAFNVIYDWRTQQFTVKAGDELWVRTKASGAQWLAYKATQFYTPNKYGPNGLANDSDIWGTAPLPNTLITVGCLQPQALGVETTQNIVVKWVFTSVKS